MFYDLNIPWGPAATYQVELQRTMAFLNELGYNVVALNHTYAEKLPSKIACPIPSTLPFPVPTNIRILRRCTLVLSDAAQNHRLSELSAAFDIVALRPTDEKTLQSACITLDCDIISLDLTTRLGFYFRFKTLSCAIERGIRFEICYAPALLATDSAPRRNLISNTTQLIRATRGRGLIISSEASRAVGCRGPWDLINLAAVWGLGTERGKEAIDKQARAVVVGAQFKRTSFKGVVDIVYGGEKPDKSSEGKGDSKGKRRLDGENGGGKQNKPPPKKELQRRAKKVKVGV